MDVIENIDPEKDARWDPFVQHHPYGWIVHLAGWKRVLESSFSHVRGHYLALTDSDTGEMTAGLPVYEIRSQLTGNRLVSIPFATLSDPLTTDETQTRQLLDEAMKLLLRLKYAYLEIRTLANPLPGKPDSLQSSTDYKHHFLDLTQGEEKIWKNTSYKSIRYLINKAEKNNLQARPAQTEEDIRAFYRLYANTRRRLGLPSQPFAFFKSIFDHFASSGLATILLAEMDNRIVAGHLHLKFQNRVSVEAIGEDNACRTLGVNHFLYWQAIRNACAEGFTTFDFGRTSIHNPTLMDFKKRWGSSETDLHTYHHDTRNHNVTSREEGLPYKLIRHMCHNAPGPLQPALSRFCYRHLG